MKRCSRCNQDKEINEFSNNRSSKDGKQNWCKACRKQYRADNRARILEQKKQHYADNRARLLEYKSQYRADNRARILEYQKQYHADNRAQLVERMKQYRADHPNRMRYNNMLARCYNPNNTYYKDYGGRGITVCDRWRDSYEAYNQDIGECPGDGYTIDRIDNDGNYEPGNVRWATAIEQNNNRRCCGCVLTN